jgi:hypothetical protein
MEICGMECPEEIEEIPEIDRKILEKCMEIWGGTKRSRQIKEHFFEKTF